MTYIFRHNKNQKPISHHQLFDDYVNHKIMKESLRDYQLCTFPVCVNLLLSITFYDAGE